MAAIRSDTVLVRLGRQIARSNTLSNPQKVSVSTSHIEEFECVAGLAAVDGAPCAGLGAAVGASTANFTVVVALIEYFPAAAETLIKACVPARLAGTSTRTEALSVNVSAATAKAVASSAALDAGKTRPPDVAPIWCCTF